MSWATKLQHSAQDRLRSSNVASRLRRAIEATCWVLGGATRANPTYFEQPLAKSMAHIATLPARGTSTDIAIVVKERASYGNR